MSFKPKQLVERVKLRMTPQGLTRVQRKNFFYCQMDAVAMGLIMGVQPFLAIYLTRLGATNFEIGLLSAIPGFAGLFLAIIIGRFLQNRRDIVPWYSWARLIQILAYAFTGLLSLLLPQQYTVAAILGLWLLVSVPQTLLSVAFTVLMSEIAGPKGRYVLLSRRWSTIGVISAIMTVVAGQILEHIRFPLNYQLAFISFALMSAVISRAYTQRYVVTPRESPPDKSPDIPLRQQIKTYTRAILNERAFVAIVIKRLVFIMGSQLVIPLFSLYYVRELQASDAQISIISTVQKSVLLIGYFFWTRQRERRGSRFVLLSTTLIVALYPAITALTHQVGWMVLWAGLATIFQAGLNLVLFDELMKTVPVEDSATFVAVAQSLQHLIVIIGPLLSTALTTYIGLSGALILGACVRLMGFGLFLFGKQGERANKTAKV